MKNLTITYAQDTEGNLVTADKASKGNRYCCIECHEELSLRVSKIPEGQKFYRRPHFAHRKDSVCHPETVLHNQFKRMAAQMLESKILQKVPLLISWKCEMCFEDHQYNLLEGVESIKMEYWLKECQPDIALLTADNTVKAVIEVVVNHKPEPQVLKYYSDNGILLIQINLQSFEDIDHLEERIMAPSKVTHCLSPICEVCGHRKNMAQMRVVDTSCWKCHHIMKMAMITDANFCQVLGPNDFTKNELLLAKQQGVTIEYSYSKTMEDSYLANVCKTCHAFIGEFYLHEYIFDESYETINIGHKCFQCINNDKRRKIEEEQEKQRIAYEKRAEQEKMIMELQMSNEIRPCPQCGGILEVKKGPYGFFFGCCNYPECRHTDGIDMANISSV